MSDISNQLIKDSYDYVLQSDLGTGVVYRIGGTIPVNPIFSSGLSIYNTFRYSDGSESNGYVLTSDGSGNATWKPISGTTPSSGVTSINVGTGLSANSTTGAVTIINTSPNQTVTLTGGTNIQITGTYPDFGVNYTGQTSFPYLFLSGGTVTGNTIFQSGLTANTISATTYLNLPSQSGTGISAFSYNQSAGLLTITKNDSSTLTAGTFNYITATTLSSGNVLSVISNGSGATTTTVNAVTGGSYSNGVITLSGTGNVDGTQITGLSALTPTTLYNGNGTLSGNRVVDIGSFTLNFSSSTQPNTIQIDGSGQVGIGMASPETDLEISGSNTSNNVVRVRFNNSGTDWNSSTNNSAWAVNNRSTTLNTFSMLSFQHGASSPAVGVARIGSKLIRYGTDPSDYRGDFFFQVRNLSNNLSTPLYISGTGQVGVGTITPTNKLHVSDVNDPVRFVGLNSASDTSIVTVDATGILHTRELSGITGSSVSGNYLPLSGGTVTGNTIFQSGLTATTISATTYQNVNAVTGGSYSNGTITLSGTGSVNGNTITGFPNSFPYLPLSGGTVTGNTFFTSGLSANTLYVTGLTQTSGITSTGGITFKQVTINSSYTATTSDYMIDVTGGTFSVTLPSAVGIQGRLLVVKNNGGGAVTVQPILGQTIDDKPFVILGETNTIQLASNGSNWVAISYNISTVNSSTGVFEFSGLSIASTTTFNVAPVKGWVVDDTTNPLSPQLYYVYYSGGTHTATYVNTATETWIYLTSGGTVSQTNIPLTEQQRRQNIFLGKLGHANLTNIINAFSQPDFVLSPLSQLRDMFVPINLINGGIYASPNGANLSFNTSANYLYGLGINFANSTLTPNALYVTGTNPCTFQYRTQTGGTASNTTLIDPTNYDVGGAITPITGTKATNQRIYLVQNGVFRVQYGQQTYNTLAAAIAGLATEQYNTFSNFTNNGILIGILSVLSTATDLSDSSKAQFFFASKFGETVGSAGGVSTTNLQQAYNNSVNPEILTNSTLGALHIKNGDGPDTTATIIEGSNSSGTTTSIIFADGRISGTTLFTNGFTANTNGVTTSSISATTYQNVNAVTGGSYSNGTITLSGTGSVNGNTITGFPNSFPYLPLSGGTVTGNTIFQSGITANTISATTYSNLPNTLYTGDGTLSGNRIVNQSGFTLNFTGTTGATFTISQKFRQGFNLQGIGIFSHAEGASSIANGNYSHAEGDSTQTYPNATSSHAEGLQTITQGTGSHSEGYLTSANGTASHAEGNNTVSLGNYSHSEGYLTSSSGLYSHSEGEKTYTYGQSSHSEGFYTYANTGYSHSEGVGYFIDSSNCVDLASLTFFEFVVGAFSFSADTFYGYTSEAIDLPGDQTSSFTSITPPVQVESLQLNSLIPNQCYYGLFTIQSINFIVTDPELGLGYTRIQFDKIIQNICPITGCTNTADGIGSHVEGLWTDANGNFSHAEGIGTVADGVGQHVSGKYNITGNTTSLLAIGNGADNNNRSDILNVNQSEVLVFGGFSANTISASTYYNLPVSGLTEGSNISITGSNGNFTVSFTGTTGSNFTGGTVTGATLFTNGLSANTISATTYLNINAITGGSFSNGTLTFSGTGSFLPSITGFGTGNSFTGGTVTGATNFTNGVTANTLTVSAATDPVKFIGVQSGLTDTLILTVDGTGVVHTLPLSLYNGITWNNSTTTQTASQNNGYVGTASTLTTITLPSTASFGSVIEVVGTGTGLWRLSQNASQSIKFGVVSTTTGTGGYLSATSQYDCVKLLCTSANTTFVVTSAVGNIFYN